jgi:hypothetical protein
MGKNGLGKSGQILTGLSVLFGGKNTFFPILFPLPYLVSTV